MQITFTAMKSSKINVLLRHKIAILMSEGMFNYTL
jgi:hypothetical protein